MAINTPGYDSSQVNKSGRSTEQERQWKLSVSRFVNNYDPTVTNSLVVGEPTDGNLGDGTLNAEEIYEDGKRVFVQEGNATGGLEHTALDHGTVSSGTLTISPVDAMMHQVVCGGAFELDVATNVWGTAVLHILNNGSAGDITPSANLTKKYPGSSLNTVNGNMFTVTFYFLGSFGCDYSVQARQ